MNNDHLRGLKTAAEILGALGKLQRPSNAIPVALLVSIGQFKLPGKAFCFKIIYNAVEISSCYVEFKILSDQTFFAVKIHSFTQSK